MSSGENLPMSSGENLPMSSGENLPKSSGENLPMSSGKQPYFFDFCAGARLLAFSSLAESKKNPVSPISLASASAAF